MFSGLGSQGYELAITAAATLANAVYEMGQQIGLVTNGRDAVDRMRAADSMECVGDVARPLGAPAEEVRPEALAGMMLELQREGCHNVNLVSPSHVVPQILAAALIAARAGLRRGASWARSACRCACYWLRTWRTRNWKRRPPATRGRRFAMSSRRTARE